MTGQSQVRSIRNAPVRFTREKYFPKGWESCLAQFLKLFHRYGYIYRPLSGGTWLSANEKWALTDTEIIKSIACAHPNFILGTRAGKKTRYAVLDIDAKSRYHSKPQLERLLHVLARAGIKQTSLFRSSFSGGWHLYMFFDEDLNCKLIHRQLVNLLRLSDFDVAAGTLEVFPNPGNGSSGMGLRLPLQPGFAWLDKKTLEVEYERHELSATRALTCFLDRLDSETNPVHTFRQLSEYALRLQKKKERAEVHGLGTTVSNVIALRRPEKPFVESESTILVASIFGHMPHKIIVENWCRGRKYHIEGLTGPSQRADAIKCLGHYFFYGDPSRDLPALGYDYETERKWAIKQFLEARHNGYSKDLNRDRTDAIAQIDRATSWRPAEKKHRQPKQYVLSRPISWVRENANRKSDARKRIKEALAGLKKRGSSFTTVELQQAASCSRRTLYVHSDLWRSDYENLAAGFFAICTDEYNAAVEAACPKSKPPSAVSEKFVPPGLLAARRVVYELSMRAKRDIQRRQSFDLFVTQSAEKAWRDKVASLTKTCPSSLSIRDLKPLLSVLTHYLCLAPYEEDANQLLPYIEHLKKLIGLRTIPTIECLNLLPPPDTWNEVL